MILLLALFGWSLVALATGAVIGVQWSKVGGLVGAVVFLAAAFALDRYRQLTRGPVELREADHFDEIEFEWPRDDRRAA
jgi:hypothetical protein